MRLIVLVQEGPTLLFLRASANLKKLFSGKIGVLAKSIQEKLVFQNKDRGVSKL